jgi:hypothetical protein
VVEYVRSASRHFLKVKECMNTMVINLLLTDKRYFELHQYLQVILMSTDVLLSPVF